MVPIQESLGIGFQFDIFHSAARRPVRNQFPHLGLGALGRRVRGHLKGKANDCVFDRLLLSGRPSCCADGQSHQRVARQSDERQFPSCRLLLQPVYNFLDVRLAPVYPITIHHGRPTCTFASLRRRNAEAFQEALQFGARATEGWNGWHGALRSLLYGSGNLVLIINHDCHADVADAVVLSHPGGKFSDAAIASFVQLNLVPFLTGVSHCSISHPTPPSY